MKHLDAMLLKEVADGGLVQDGQGTKFALLDHDGLIYMYDEECEVAVGGVVLEVEERVVVVWL